MAKEKKEKKENKGKAGGSTAKRKDPTATAVGSALGLIVVAWACWQLIQGQLDLLGAAKVALVALGVALVTEKGVFPLTRMLMGPTRDP